MAIDTSIYGQLKPVQIESPVNALAQVTQLKNAQNQNRLFDMQVADSERARADDNAVRNAYTLDDPTARANALRLASPKAYREEQTFQTNQQKAQREADKAKTEHVKAMVDLQGQLLGSVKDQPTWEQALQIASDAGMDVSKFPTQYDPAFVKSAAARSLTESQRLEQEWKQKGYDLDVSKFGETKRHNRSTEGIAGGNLRVAQEGLGLRRAEVANGRIPSGYRAKGDGTLEPIPGGPADPNNKSAKATTEGEKASAGYGLRMVEAEKELDKVARASPDAQKPGLIERAAGNSLAANYVRDSDRQQYRQAQEDWVRAKLRKESGAAIPTEEMDREIQTYFPQPGDGAAVAKQKARARETATKAMGIAAGTAENEMYKGVGGRSSDSPKAGSVVDGYRFKGGNPADKNNWERQ